MRDRVERVSEELARRSLTLVTAESCTGGLLAALFTDRAGASRFFENGFITYSDGSKERLLDVDRESLAAHGAVSEVVAREMVTGALHHGDVAVAITGIAGPGGGSEQKPVGTVWVALGTRDGTEARKYVFPGDRGAVRTASVEAAVEMLETWLVVEE